MAAQWFLVWTKPQLEWLAARNARRNGYEVFFPHSIVKTRHARQTREATRAYFPRYIFAEVDPSRQSFGRLKDTIGVSEIISNAAGPAPIPTPDIRRAMAACRDDGRVIPPPPLRDRLCPGAVHRIDHGPFAALTAKVREIDSHGNVRVWLGIFGSEVMATLRASDLGDAIHPTVRCIG